MTIKNRSSSVSPDSTTIPPTEEGARERIVTAAITLFAAKGYDRTPVREIVEAAGVTKPVLYYYFRNKEDLFRWIIEDRLSDFHRRLIDACEGDHADLITHLASVAQVYFDKAREEPDLVRFILTVVFSGLFDHMFNFEEQWREETEQIASVFERAQSDGLIRNDISTFTMAFHFIGMVVNVMKGLIYYPYLLEEEPDGAVLARLYLDGFHSR